jgi:hypothetical protein
MYLTSALQLLMKEEGRRKKEEVFNIQTSSL